MVEQQSKLEQSPGNMKSGDRENTRKPRKHRDEIKFRKYVFTWFGATEQKIKEFIAYCEKRNYKYMLGDEICPTTGKQHWQGYVEGKNSWAKSTLDRLIDGGWCESAKGSVKDNWKYTGKDGKVLTNFTEEEIKANDTEEIVIDTLKHRIETNRFKINWSKQIETDDDYREAAEYIKYMSMVEKYTILNRSRTEMIKQITKSYKAMKGKLKGIIIFGECDIEIISELENGIILDSNGNVLTWDNYKVPVRHIFRMAKTEEVVVKIPKVKDIINYTETKRT